VGWAESPLPATVICCCCCGEVEGGRGAGEEGLGVTDSAGAARCNGEDENREDALGVAVPDLAPSAVSSRRSMRGEGASAGAGTDDTGGIELLATSGTGSMKSLGGEVSWVRTLVAPAIVASVAGVG